jgi:hypothetical protein
VIFLIQKARSILNGLFVLVWVLNKLRLKSTTLFRVFQKSISSSFMAIFFISIDIKWRKPPAKYANPIRPKSGMSFTPPITIRLIKHIQMIFHRTPNQYSYTVFCSLFSKISSAKKLQQAFIRM